MAMKAGFSSKEEKPQKKSKAKVEEKPKIHKRRKDKDGNSVWYWE